MSIEKSTPIAERIRNGEFKNKPQDLRKTLANTQGIQLDDLREIAEALVADESVFTNAEMLYILQGCIQIYQNVTKSNEVVYIQVGLQQPPIDLSKGESGSISLGGNQPYLPVPLEIARTKYPDAKPGSRIMPNAFVNRNADSGEMFSVPFIIVDETRSKTDKATKKK